MKVSHGISRWEKVVGAETLVVVGETEAECSVQMMVAINGRGSMQMVWSRYLGAGRMRM